VIAKSSLSTVHDEADDWPAVHEPAERLGGIIEMGQRWRRGRHTSVFEGFRRRNQIVQAVPGIQLNMGMSGFGLSIGPRDRGKGERERPGDVWLRTHD